MMEYLNISDSSERFRKLLFNKLKRSAVRSGGLLLFLFMFEGNYSEKLQDRNMRQKKQDQNKINL
jgi:hypothetical protein